MSSKPIFTMQIKGQPLISLPGDSRPWALDVYGMHDGFATPVEDPDGPEMGPPTMRVPAGDSGRFNPCMIPTVARLQGYDSVSNLWRRVKANDSGNLETVVNNTVTVTMGATELVMDYGSVTVGTTETLLLSVDITRRFVTFCIQDGSPNVWISPAGAGSSGVGSGIKVTPTQPFTFDKYTTGQQWYATAESGTVDVSIIFGSPP